MDEFPRHPEPDEARTTSDANLALAQYEPADAADHGNELPLMIEPASDLTGEPTGVSHDVPPVDGSVAATEAVSNAALEPPQTATLATQAVPMPAPVRVSAWRRIVAELTAGVQTLFSAAVYATLIVTFGFQVARVDGLSMAPTLEDHDR